MRFFNRRQFMILSVACVVMGAFLLLRHLPLQRSKAAVRKAFLDQERVMAQAQAQVQQLPQLREQVEKLRLEAGDFEAKVPCGKPAYGRFLQQITELMSKHHLQEQSVQPRKEVQAEQVNCIPVNVRGKGNLKQIFQFFKSLQKLDRQIRISRVELTNPKGLNNDEAKVSMEVDIGIYYTPNNQNQI